MRYLIARSLTLPLIAAVVLLSGCGSVSKWVGGRSARAGSPAPAGTPVASFLATVDPATGQIRFRPDRSGVSAQATPYGGGDDIVLSGSATYNSGTAILSGDVTISTSNVIEFYDVRAVVAEISSSAVTIANSDGVTTLIPNRNSDYWAYGTVSRSTPRTRNWQFRVPDGASFTFRVQLWANVWKFSAGDGGTLQGLCFLSRTRGWAVGASGKILMTTDGATWTPQVANVAQHLFGVHFVDESYGWAVGAGGTILATRNGGRTWQAQEWRRTVQEGSVTLTAVRFANRLLGWAVGTEGTILRTRDGGQTWTRVSVGTVETLHDVDCHGPDLVWAVGEGTTILHSRDGGETWTPQTVRGADQFLILTAVDFVSPTRGMAVGTLGTALLTTDGGATWIPVNCAVGTLNLQDVDFADSSLVYVAGQSGSLRRSRDGGLNWEWVDSGGGSNLVAIECVDGSYAWAAGSDGVIIRTTTAGAVDGARWGTTLRGTSNSLNGIDFLNAAVGAAVGREGTVLLTTDGGASWRQIPGPGPMTLTGVQLRSVNGQTRIWVVGAGATIAYSDDSGLTWVMKTPLSISSANVLFGLHFVSSTVGIACGSNGILLHTSDGGATWSRKGSGLTNQSLNAVRFASASSVWAVGSGGTILYSDDGGNTWGQTGSPTGEALLAVAAVDDQHAWICGQNGRLFALGGWGSLGPNWIVQSSNTLSDLNGIDFVDTLRGWAVGSSGTLLRTEDGGASWIPVNSNLTSSLNAVRFRDPDDAWMVGSGGLIQRFH